MNIDDWKRLVKQIVGPVEFREIALEFLHAHFHVPVHDTDGKGDGGIDAWIVLSAEPLLRMPAQFHAGKAHPWDQKLEEDVAKLHAAREALPADDAKRNDLRCLNFVCSQETDKTHAGRTVFRLLQRYEITVQIFDAGTIVSAAVQSRGRLLQLLAERLPGAPSDARKVLPSAREQVIRAFAFFHPNPAKFRWEVAKSVLGTVLQRAAGRMTRERLLAEASMLLHQGVPPLLLERALRNLQHEQLIVVEEPEVSIHPAFGAMTTTALRIADADEEGLREQCAAVLEPFLAKGTHHREVRARRAVDTIFGDLGLLVRTAVADRALSPLDPRALPQGRRDDETRQRWRAVEGRLAAELALDERGLRDAFAALVGVVAASPFAQSLAAAELFLQLTEYDAEDIPQVLGLKAPVRIALDASIALPMLCALYDRPALDWQTSLAAHALHQSLRSRGAGIVVPSLYVEEMAAHLIKAWEFEGLVETTPELARSRNFFVAHYCSTRGDDRCAAEFRRFLSACGAERPAAEQWQQKAQLRRAERELTARLMDYAIETAIVEMRLDDHKLPGEPTTRDDKVIRHDRAVVRWLVDEAPGTALCTADRWLQGVLGKRDVTAIDSAAMTDLLQLLRPLGATSRLLTPLAIAQTLTEEHRVLAAAIWDELVALEGAGLVDWELHERAKAFHARWVASQETTAELSAAWLQFRDGA